MSAKPTLQDIYCLRLHRPKFGLPIAAAAHNVQCANLALKAGADDEMVLACMLHDIGLGLMRPDHGWWGALLVEPYVSERVSWAIRHHQALRFYADPAFGYEYPAMYHTLFGPDYKMPDYIEAAYLEARNHRWYDIARTITVHDDYSFDRTAPFDLEPFTDLIGRHFRNPPEGLGNDNSRAAHMWRTIIDPTKPL